MHGGRATHLVIVAILALLAALAAATPALARDSALLGGYGGPGQGNQVILGSTLLNGPRDGGGGGGSGGALSPSASGAGTVQASASAGKLEVSSGGKSGAPAGSPARGRHASSRHGKPAPSGLEPAPGQASRPARADSQTLGLTGEELLLSLVALAALTLTGVLTRRLTRTSEPRRHA
jgi:hypothetical protein